jgi:trehalose/maltose hydrolase-like predicted phosphorylase
MARPPDVALAPCISAREHARDGPTPDRVVSNLDETFEAVVLDWDDMTLPDRQSELSPLRERIEDLCGAGVHVVIVTGSRVEDIDEQIWARPPGRGRLHISCAQGSEVYNVTTDGPRRVFRTERADAARWAADWLSHQGITGELVLVCEGSLGSGGGPDGGDHAQSVFARAVAVSLRGKPDATDHGFARPDAAPARLIALLDQQLDRRATFRVPKIDLDPAWVVPLPTGHNSQRVAEALGAVGNGSATARGSREEDGRGSAPLFLVNGCYTPDGHLLPCPDWTTLELTGTDHRHRDRRVLDLRGGTLVRMSTGTESIRSLRFVSMDDPHAVALRAEGPEIHLQAGEPLRAPPGDALFHIDDDHGTKVATAGPRGNQVAVAARDRVTTTDGRRVVERLGAWVAAPVGTADPDEARDRLARLDDRGFDALLADHRAAWARRWDDAEVVIEGDPEAELSARFAVFHLLCAAANSGESAVPARGLTGNAYGGHVFWDADVFVLPALVALRPAAARAMLEYRIRRLPAARDQASAEGRSGARFPWESAGDGRDVTPRLVRGPHNELVPIATGANEAHIVADVAWAAVHYAAWTGDDAFLNGAGRDLVVDTARYWADRIRTDAAGRGHIDGVIGPDEYHTGVDDNAYTNVMARWNLLHGANLLSRSGGDEEAEHWRNMAGRLVDGWSPERGLYEQFAGYFDLDPLVMSEFAPPPVAADVLLGAERVSGSQLIKQADVLMLHHLVPDEVRDGSLRPCLDFYGPRTAHGSSLSPAIHAALLARGSQPERALEMFRMAARLDLDDRTGTTAEGLHLATMGGVWQALAFGFLGVRANKGVLAVNPCLPEDWHALGLRFRFRGRPLCVRAERRRVTITSRAALLVRIGDQPPVRLEAGTTDIPLSPTPRTSHP